MGIFKNPLVLLLLFVTFTIYGAEVNINFMNEAPLDATCTIFINDDAKLTAANVKDPVLKKIFTALNPIADNIQLLGWRPSIHSAGELAGGKLIFVNTRKLNTDISDSRSIYQAAVEAFKFAVDAGCLKPFLVLGPMKSANSMTGWRAFNYRYLNAVLGALQGLYMPYDLILAGRLPATKYDSLTVYTMDCDPVWVKKYAVAIEKGREIARDLCGADPEVMNPTNFVKYVNDHVATGLISVKKIDIDEEKYPMIAAVERANAGIPRFNGSILELTYTNADAQSNNLYDELFMVGEGLTFDVGGLDIRTSGKMVGMSRKKCGAAGVIGFIKTASLLPDAKIKISAKVAVVRNNIGSRGFSGDDIVLANGKRVKIGFTEAIGRTMLGELLHDYVEAAANSQARNKYIYTVATMSEHVVKVWKYFTGIMVNEQAGFNKIAQSLQDAGDLVSDMGEISDLIKEDYDASSGPLETEDLRASKPEPSVSTTRGHMIPAAYMMRVSGIDEHGYGSAKPVNYIHLDVSGSAGKFFDRPTGSPVSMLTQMHLIKP